MKSFKELQDTISAALVSTTRSATQLNSADLSFQRSLEPTLGPALDAQNARLLQLAQRLLANAAASSDAVGPTLPDVDAIDGNWRGVVDVVDSLLEKADTSLDEYTGAVKKAIPGADQVRGVGRVMHSQRLTCEQAPASVKPRFPNVPKTLPKPQLLFETKPNNYETGGFRPILTSKPHARIPLEKCLQTFRDKHGREQYGLDGLQSEAQNNDSVTGTRIHTKPRSKPMNTLNPCMRRQSLNPLHRSTLPQPHL